MLIGDLDAHLTGSAFDLAHSSFDVNRVHVVHFDLCDFAYLVAA